MGETDQIIKKKLSYSGVFDLKEFYEMLAGVIGSLGYEISEGDHKFKGKSYAFIWNCDKQVDDYSQLSIWLRFDGTSLKEVEVDDNGVKRKMYQGDIYILFKGSVTTDYGGRWEANPYLVFLKGFFDKYLYGRQGSPALAKGAYASWVKSIDSDVKEVINEIKSFLHLYKL